MSTIKDIQYEIDQLNAITKDNVIYGYEEENTNKEKPFKIFRSINSNCGEVFRAKTSIILLEMLKVYYIGLVEGLYFPKKIIIT